MKIENRTKLSEFFLSPLFLVSTSFILVITILIIYKVDASKKFDISYSKAYNKKINEIKTKKYALMCGDTILQPSEYDLVKITDQDKIITTDTFSTPNKGIDVGRCEVIITQTSSMVKPIVIDDNEKTKAFKEKIKELETQITYLNATIQGDNDALNKQKKETEDIYLYASKQKERLDKYIIMEARFEENKALLEKLINKMNITSESGRHYNIDDLIVEQKQIIKKEPKIPKPKPMVTNSDINQNNYKVILQKKLYALRTVSRAVAMNKKWEGKFTIPTDEVNKIELTKNQIDNYMTFNKQLDSSLTSLLYVLSKKQGTSMKVLELEVYGEIKN